MNNNGHIEKELWDSADQLRANSSLKAQDYSEPVLGLIFLRYADHKFARAEKELAKSATGRREISKIDYQAKGVMYLPKIARFAYLTSLPEGSNIGKAVNEAMEAIETENDDLKGILPNNYSRLENAVLFNLIKKFSAIKMDMEGDVFGKIYEYFLGRFAMSEGQKGGEFFTPISIVKLIVEVIEPFHGMIYDPACGSGGMFVQSARFVENHKKNPTAEISVYGQEKTAETVRLCKMNLAVHGLSGDIKEGNTYYNDVHKSVGQFDFVMANPPFNVNGINKEELKDDPRFPFGLPRNDNGNYLWIQHFYSALNPTGRAGFVMANSAGDARQSELEIRKKLILNHAVDVIIAISSNFFYTVTLPCTLWFLDKAKKNTDRKDKILFIDARNIYQQLDRAHRDFKPEQIDLLANIVRLYRGEKPEFTQTITDSELADGLKTTQDLLKQHFPDGKYQDTPGLCKVATLEEVEKQSWSLSPGRYVGAVEHVENDGISFEEKFTALHDEFQRLTSEAHELEKQIDLNAQDIVRRLKTDKKYHDLAKSKN